MSKSIILASTFFKQGSLVEDEQGKNISMDPFTA